MDRFANARERQRRLLRLATTRYQIGLSGIVELTQAQLALTSAQISAASAKYAYLARVADLSYATGALR
jgi:outer membrane protein